MANPGTLDEQIAESIRRSQESGELQTAKDWGKRTTYVDGYQETPEEYRMAFKALKDSGYVPAEVEMSADHWTAAVHFTVPYAKWGMKNPSTLFLKVNDSVEIDLVAAGSVTTPSKQGSTQ